MKFGIRKPSLKKRISARTSVKRQLVHRAGLKMPKGTGWARNPKNTHTIKYIKKHPLIFLK